MVYCSNVNKNIAQAKIQNENLRALYLANISTTDLHDYEKCITRTFKQ